MTPAIQSTAGNRAVICYHCMPPQRMWAECTYNGVTLAIGMRLQPADKSWSYAFHLIYQSKTNRIDNWFRATSGRSIPVRRRDVVESERRIEFQLPWPWHSRIVFVRPSDQVRRTVHEFLRLPSEPLLTRDAEATLLACVIGRLTVDTIRVSLQPDTGLTDGGVPIEIPLNIVPVELRAPNTLLQVTLRNGEVVGVAPSEL